MFTYLIKSCANSETSIMSANTSLSAGQAILFGPLNTEDSLCGIVLNETTGVVESYYIDPQDDCCTCLTETQGYTSLSFLDCTGGTKDISLVDFCLIYGDTPQIGEYFRIFNTGTSETICGSIVGLSTNTPSENWIPDEGPYVNCSDCEPDIPRSAGTETFVCEVCCPCESGSTFTIIPPHPVWTDAQGIAVTQLNAITLGGENGLNS